MTVATREDHHRLWSAARIIVSIAVAAVLITRVPRGELSAAAPDFTPMSGFWTAGALVATLIAVGLSAARWQLVLQVLGRPAPFRRLVELTLAGQFVGTVLPTSIGGDALRVHRLARDTSHGPSSFASVVIERLSGWFILPVLTILALTINRGLLEFGPSRFALALAVVVLVGWTIVILIALSPWAGRWGSDTGWRRFFAAIHEGLLACRTQPAQVGRIFLSGTAYQLVLIAAGLMLARGFGIDASPTALMAFLPSVLIIQLIPISIGGLGVRESALVLYLQPLGVPAGEAILLGLLIYAVNILVGLLGAPAFAAGSRPRDKAC
jgi:glycosyltransferase 2 family protein